MDIESLAHLTDAELLRQLAALVAQDRVNTGLLLAHLAEVDARRLYLPRGFSSMHAFCVEELRFSDETAFKRIRAARAARRFPALLTALSEGRLHLTGVSLIATHLTPENAKAVIEATTHKRSKEIEEWLAERFQIGEPRNIQPVVRVISPLRPPQVDDTQPQLLLGRGHEPDQQQMPETSTGLDLSYGLPREELSARTVPESQVQAAPRFHFQFVVPKSTHDKLCRAQVLLSHSVPSGDLAQVFDRALDALIKHLELRLLGSTARRLQRRQESDSDGSTRHIPVAIRRAVWERDEGRCTFISITGGRCRRRTTLELDHVVPFARGGKATVANLRLRCDSHNQYEAERVFGVEFMKRKRQESLRDDAPGAADGPEVPT